jgi:hypothetical protein
MIVQFGHSTYWNFFEFHTHLMIVNQWPSEVIWSPFDGGYRQPVLQRNLHHLSKHMVDIGTEASRMNRRPLALGFIRRIQIT